MDKQNRHHDEIGVRRRLEGSLKGTFLESHWARLRGAVREYRNDLLSWEDLRGLAQDSLELQRDSAREILEKYGKLVEPEDSDSGGTADTPRRSSFRPEL